MRSLLYRFASEQDGAEPIEYSLVIAVVSIALIVALSALTANGASFSVWIGRVSNCLTTSTCT